MTRPTRSNAPTSFYRRAGKRFLDLALSTVLIVLLAPVMLLTAVAVRIALGRPVLFRQTRPGLAGAPFELVKFRSMATSAKGARGESDRDRLSPFGRWLRRTSLDELPELFGVLSGSMSLVGPRPLLMDYLPRYTTRQMRRHEVRPGITGWAQVNGRNAVDWDQKFELDVQYVDSLSLMLDLRILARTAWITVSGRGVSAEGEATTSEFRGTDRS